MSARKRSLLARYVAGVLLTVLLFPFLWCFLMCILLDRMEGTLDDLADLADAIGDWKDRTKRC